MSGSISRRACGARRAVALVVAAAPWLLAGCTDFEATFIRAQAFDRGMVGPGQVRGCFDVVNNKRETISVPAQLVVTTPGGEMLYSADGPPVAIPPGRTPCLCVRTDDTRMPPMLTEGQVVRVRTTLNGVTSTQTVTVALVSAIPPQNEACFQ